MGKTRKKLPQPYFPSLRNKRKRRLKNAKNMAKTLRKRKWTLTRKKTKRRMRKIKIKKRRRKMNLISKSCKILAESYDLNSMLSISRNLPNSNQSKKSLLVESSWSGGLMEVNVKSSNQFPLIRRKEMPKTQNQRLQSHLNTRNNSLTRILLIVNLVNKLFKFL